MGIEVALSGIVISPQPDGNGGVASAAQAAGQHGRGPSPCSSSNSASASVSRTGSAARRAAIARPLLRGIARWSRLDAIDAFLTANRHVRGFDFVSAALQFLGADYTVDAAALARIPAQGRLLVVANHPSGALDALALLDAIGKVRRDVRIVANDMLSALDNLDGLLLPVRILGGRPAPDSLRAVDTALAGAANA
jgi:putative hemolysin